MKKDSIFAENREENEYEVCNIDSLILIQSPKMKPYIPQMKKNIAEVFGINVDQVNVKATTGERMGFVGNKEGVVAEAVVLIDRKK